MGVDNLLQFLTWFCGYAKRIFKLFEKMALRNGWSPLKEPTQYVSLTFTMGSTEANIRSKTAQNCKHGNTVQQFLDKNILPFLLAYKYLTFYFFSIYTQ